jgi:hypothetical protein
LGRDLSRHHVAEEAGRHWSARVSPVAQVDHVPPRRARGPRATLKRRCAAARRSRRVRKIYATRSA